MQKLTWPASVIMAWSEVGPCRGSPKRMIDCRHSDKRMTAEAPSIMVRALIRAVHLMPQAPGGAKYRSRRLRPERNGHGDRPGLALDLRRHDLRRQCRALQR